MAQGRGIGTPALIDVAGLGAMLTRLRSDGYRVIGPVVRDGAVVYDDVTSIDDLPGGVADEQDAAHYRLTMAPARALFAHTVGPQTWKRFLYPPRERQWLAVRTGAGNGFEVEAEPHDEAPLALVGVRACDLAALDVLDRILLADTAYAARRGRAFVIAVACATPSGTCFCESMGTGPRPANGYDLRLTELCDDARDVFVVETGSARGTDLLGAAPHVDATPNDLAEAEAVIVRARAAMGRALDADGVREALLDALDDPHWDEVAARCLACGNCTLVCPTCFCSTTEDVTDLAGERSARWRHWDSCFTLDHSYIHGGSIRASTRARYRQWLTHKLATWSDQFGTAGCVGCGRCITWCPAGIDLTAEAAAFAKASS